MCKPDYYLFWLGHRNSIQLYNYETLFSFKFFISYLIPNGAVGLNSDD